MKQRRPLGVTRAPRNIEYHRSYQGDHSAHVSSTSQKLQKLLVLLTFLGLASLSLRSNRQRIGFDLDYCSGICYVPKDRFNWKCGPWDTNRVVYVRIPKTGSFSFLKYTGKLANAKAFGLMQLYDWKDAVPQVESFSHERQGYNIWRKRHYQKLLASKVLFPEHPYNRTLVYGHFFYVDWTNARNSENYDYPIMKYFPVVMRNFVRTFVEDISGHAAPDHDEIRKTVQITIMRTPRDRLESMYNYDRTLANNPKWRTQYISRRGNLTFEDCLIDEECVEKNQLRRWCSIQTQFFCGMAPGCDHPLSEKSLARAKQNLHAFLFVGLMEKFNSTVTILSRLLPTYFENPAGTHTKLQREKIGGNKAPVTSSAALRTLEDLCRFDNELYSEAAALFDERATLCSF